MAAAKEISADAALAGLVSERDGILTLKGEAKTKANPKTPGTLKAFVC